MYKWLAGLQVFVALRNENHVYNEITYRPSDDKNCQHLLSNSALSPSAAGGSSCALLLCYVAIATRLANIHFAVSLEQAH